MTDQIECVGGPMDSRRMCHFGNVRVIQLLPKSLEDQWDYDDHIYAYDPSSNKYIYKGVEK